MERTTPVERAGSRKRVEMIETITWGFPAWAVKYLAL